LVSQKDFLLSLGAQERAQDLIAKNPQQSAEIKSALNRLISPQEMGELFKVHISWNLG
jgi:SAM-dependent MidA family methyltransferase